MRQRKEYNDRHTAPLVNRGYTSEEYDQSRLLDSIEKCTCRAAPFIAMGHTDHYLTRHEDFCFLETLDDYKI